MIKTAVSSEIWAKIPMRSSNTSKSDYGKVLCVCGSRDYRGAAALCCLGALRIGAGLVTLAAEECVINSIASRILEATFLPLPNDEALQAKASCASSLLIGCGLYENEDSSQLVRTLLPLCNGTVILDAGALCSIKSEMSILSQAKGTAIITPHIGELAKLTGLSTEEIHKNRAAIAQKYAKEWQTILVLKGSHTLVASPNGILWQNTTGNAGLARGGSGDILAGMIAGLAAIGLSAEDAAKCGVYLHGYAADLCAARLSMQTMLPEDILTDLSNIFRENGR